MLLDMARKPSSRPFHDAEQELSIITGMGNNSKDGEAVIKVRPLARLPAGFALEEELVLRGPEDAWSIVFEGEH